MGKGRRFDDEPKLNIKKVIAVILAILVVAMSIYVIIGIVTKSNEEGKVISKDYFVSYKDNKWGVIDQAGETVIAPSYKEMIIIPNSKKDVFLCTYNVDYKNETYKTKAINKEGTAIYTEYEQIEAFQNIAENDTITYENNILKVKKDDKYGVINIDGENVIPCEYEDINVMQGVGYIIKKDDKYGIIDALNKEIIKPEYESIEKAHNNDLYVVTKNQKQILVKKDGTEILTEGYDEISAVLKNADNGVIFKSSNKYGVMKQDGEIVIEAKYDELKEAKTGILIAKQDGKYGIINLKDEAKVGFKYISISYSEKADIYIAQNEEYSDDIIDNEFTVKLTGILLDIDEEKGYMELRENGEYKYYNFRFEEKEETDIFKATTLFVRKKDGKYGFVDKEGKVVVDYIYDDAVNQNALGYSAIKKDGKWGAIDSKGQVIQEPTYNLDDYLKIDFVGRWHLGKDVNMNYYNQE